jgi:hypothetical protein
VIQVKSVRKAGIWRCGVFHGPEPTEYPDNRFTARQLAALKDEPLLEVTVAKGKTQEPVKPAEASAAKPTQRRAKK